MAAKVCCIQKCKSCSTRSEDIGVTYHKFPKDVALCDTWIKVTHHCLTRTDTPVYVCSRHFCKNDFQIFKDSKYVLKSDAVPSIFPWITKEMDSSNPNMESPCEGTDDALTSKESEGENLEAIKKFIEDQEKEFQKQDAKNEEETTVVEKSEVDESKDFDERLAVASSMMDMILSESEERIVNKNKTSPKQSLNSNEKGNSSMALSVGSQVEAKDFSELWYPAKIVEVDYEEMEVLVHYENPSKKHDEWISVSSPRLRPITASVAASPVPTPTEPSGPAVGTATAPEETKPVDEKQKIVFVVGERCLARWRDNRRFMATVTKDLGDGQYEVAFDDGFQWKCATNRLHKLKDQSKTDLLNIDTSSSSSTASAQSPVLYGMGPSTIQPPPITPAPAYHTHLFDPTRDYLGSKSERREMKRKLNIKEIFNIGQKKYKRQMTPKPPAEAKPKPRIIRRKTAPVTKKEIPDAVASIIGTCDDAKVDESKKVVQEETKTDTTTTDTTDTTKIALEDLLDEKVEDVKEIPKVEEVKDENNDKVEIEAKMELSNEASDVSEGSDSKADIDPVQEEEVKLEKFEQQDEDKHEEVIDRMKEVINKLEDGINKAESSPKPKEEIKPEVKEEVVIAPQVERREKKLSKIKKGKKLRLLQEKKVKKQVAKVKSELEVMKRQFEEMRQKMLAQTEQLAKGQKQQQEMPESYLLPGEWCCKWVNGQPVGTVSELEGEVRDVNSKPGLPRRSVQVEDKRLPPGWTKHMVRRSLGNSAGKWDVVLVSPDNRRFHTRTDMRNYMAACADEALLAHEHVLMDFGIHLKLSRRMGWVSFTPGGVDNTPVVSLPAGTLCSTSPLVKRRKLSLKRELKKEKKERKKEKKKRKQLSLTIKVPKYLARGPDEENIGGLENTAASDSLDPSNSISDAPPLEDGYVWVGSLKVQIIENLLRCPAEGCYKNFRNNTLLQMHIKHYHRDLRKMLGRTPKVLDLAYARTMPTGQEIPKVREPDLKVIKVKIPRPPKRVEEPKLEQITEEIPIPQVPIDVPTPQIKLEPEPIPKIQDSPKLRNALVTKKRPRVLLPVRRPDPEPDMCEPEMIKQEVTSETVIDFPLENLDFETAISTHTVTKPILSTDKKSCKATLSEDDEWLAMTSDVETRSSFPRSGTPDSKTMDQKPMPVSSESNEEKNSNMYMYTESGERIKIVHMKREEIINCHCGFREEDGLMVQCELCLCWQHAMCHNIQKESEVPEKYTCSICLNPRRGRRSKRFLHDQDRLYEGLLPGARPCETLRRAHELSGNLTRAHDALHALRVKYHVATKKDHPKLYLWAKDWENGELTLTQEKLNSDYSDLNIMISGIGKENLPLKQEDLKDLDVQTPPSEEHDRYNQRDAQLGTSSLLSGLLSSPGASLDLPISSSEIERLAKTVQEEAQRVSAPQPEAAIENGACRERLLRHIQRCQAVIDARLDSIEAQVAELESQDPSFEDDETADYFPRTKQTIQMLMRDLDTMEELGVIT